MVQISSENVFPAQTKIYSTQNDFSISNLGSFGNRPNSSKKKGQNVVTTTTTFTQGFDTNTHNNVFSGSLIDVLNEQIGKKEEKGTKNENEAIFGTSSEIMENMSSSINIC